MNPALYVLIKLTAYCFWCYVGFRLLRPEDPALAKAMAFGTIRLFFGFFFGVCIFFLSLSWAYIFGTTGLPQNILAYLFAYVPVRWIEWSIMALLISPALRSARGWLVGCEGRDRWWRVGGIVISCVADIPFIAAFNGPIPTGRFLC